MASPRQSKPVRFAARLPLLRGRAQLLAERGVLAPLVQPAAQHRPAADQRFVDQLDRRASRVGAVLHHHQASLGQVLDQRARLAGIGGQAGQLGDVDDRARPVGRHEPLEDAAHRRCGGREEGRRRRDRRAERARPRCRPSGGSCRRSAPCAVRRAPPRAWRRRTAAGAASRASPPASRPSPRAARRFRRCSRAGRPAPRAPRGAQGAASGCKKWMPRTRSSRKRRSSPTLSTKSERIETSTLKGAAASSAAPDKQAVNARRSRSSGTSVYSSSS